MKRNDQNCELILSSVSPFLVKKVISNCAGHPKSLKLLRDGSLLIHTTSKKQADKLIKLKQLTDNILVKVFEHQTLNLSKGTIFCRYIIVSTGDEIKEDLQEQHVIDIHRMKRRDGDKQVDSGLFILTFNLPQLPTHIDAGYQLLEVREYIPNPRRCFNCQRYGHGAKHCKQQHGVCGKCSAPQHAPEECIQSMTFPNCRSNQHCAWDRRCPSFQQEMNIQRIQTTNRITNFEARKRYIESQPKVATISNLSFTDATISQIPSDISSRPFTSNTHQNP